MLNWDLNKIRIGTVIYPNCTIGDNFQTGHFVVIREGCVIGNNVLIGSYSILDGPVIIGNDVRVQTRCTITSGSIIGNNVFIAPHVVFLNDKYPPSGILTGPVVGNGAVIGGGVILLPNVSVGENAFVAAGSLVTKDVPPGKMAKGNPAKIFDIPDTYLSSRMKVNA